MPDIRPSFITSPLLNSVSGGGGNKEGEFSVQHGFFSRDGGVSQGCYRSLNVGLGSQDARADVAENRHRCADALGARDGALHTLQQIHSSRVITVTAPWVGSAPQADALVTDQAGIMLGILAADCMAFLFVDPVAKIIGAAHAGWRGALGGILEQTLNAMAGLGAQYDNIHACLGPCLRQPNFEVGLELFEQFSAKYPDAEQFFMTGKTPDKKQLDLAGFGFWRLRQHGVRHTDDTLVCTLGAPDKYFSYRHARQTHAPDYGRNLSAIMICET